MILKNSIKIFGTRFVLLWSLIVYFALLSLIVVSISVPFLTHIKSMLEQANVLQVGVSVFGSRDLPSMVGNLDSFFVVILDFFTISPSQFVGSALSMVAIVVVVARIILGLYQVPLAVCIDRYISANAKLGFAGRLVSEIKLSARYTITKLLFNLIFDFCILSLFVFVLYVLQLTTVHAAVPFVILSMFFLLLTFRQTIVCCWTGQVVVGNMLPKKAFKAAVKLSLKSFFKVFGLFALCWMCIFVFNALALGLTYGVALIVTIPISALFLSIVEMLVYYSLNDNRYYVDGKLILSKKQRLELGK